MENLNTRDSAPNETVTLTEEIGGEKTKSIEAELIKTLQGMKEGSTLSLHLKSVDRIDSRGISLIVGLFKECTLRKIMLSVTADQTAYRILSQIRLDRVIPIKEGI